MESLTVATFRLDTEQQTGIGHYIDRLVAGLEARQDIAEVQVHELKRRELALGHFRVGGYLTRYWQLMTRRIDADIVHASHVPFAHAAASSMMIQDAWWHQRPQEYPDTSWWWRRLAHRIRAMPLILAPSHTSAAAVQEALHLRRKPHVVPLAPDHDTFYPEDVAKGGYALISGDLRPRKNAFDMARAAIEAGLPVVRCGPQKSPYIEESQRIAAMAQRLGGSYRDVGYVSRDELRGLYAGAEVLLYGSEDEGWGLPPFEAAACGTQSILSPIPVHRELWPDDLAHWTTDALSVAIQDALDHPIPAARLVRHAKRYDWSRTVDGHVRAWRDLLDQERLVRASCFCGEGCEWCRPLARCA